MDYPDIERMIQSAVFNALQELFEKKHLYQSVTIDLGVITASLERETNVGFSGSGGMQARLQKYLKRIISSPWTFQSEFIIRSAKKSVLQDKRIL